LPLPKKNLLMFSWCQGYLFCTQKKSFTFLFVCLFSFPTTFSVKFQMQHQLLFVQQCMGFFDLNLECFFLKIMLPTFNIGCAKLEAKSKKMVHNLFRRDTRNCFFSHKFSFSKKKSFPSLWIYFKFFFQIRLWLEIIKCILVRNFWNWLSI
jgi:hypothetical protein